MSDSIYRTSSDPSRPNPHSAEQQCIKLMRHYYLLACSHRPDAVPQTLPFNSSCRCLTMCLSVNGFRGATVNTFAILLRGHDLWSYVLYDTFLFQLTTRPFEGAVQDAASSTMVFQRSASFREAGWLVCVRNRRNAGGCGRCALPGC
jgi:hypothetical protein